MRDLNFHLYKMCERFKEGSHAMQAQRSYMLALMANQLFTLGFSLLKPRNLKPKHVIALIRLWNNEGLTPGTIKNRMAVLRWWAEKVGKTDMIAPNNDAYNIKRRVYVTNKDKSRNIDDTLSKITDNYIRCSLELQIVFGLRREEAIKFIPTYADKGNFILLKGSWCKGGRSRTIPIINEQQREALNRAHKIAGTGSLIPIELSYREQLKRYENLCDELDLNGMHGLRHAYALTRYRILTGWSAPAAGGPRRHDLSDEQKMKDRSARTIVSTELGHHRIEITAVYLGS